MTVFDILYLMIQRSKWSKFKESYLCR